MSRNHRKDYHRAWSHLTPPLRPNHEVVAAVREQIGPAPGRTLLLGVTPELADIAPDLVALDRNYTMVTNVWPGNTSARRAVVGDWLNTNFAPDTFSFCVGDASFGALSFPRDVTWLCEEVWRILGSGGKLVCRVFVAPDVPETVAAVRDAAMSGAIRNFHAFKFRLAMAIAAEGGRVAVGVDSIFKEFTGLFRDRDALVRMTGWDRQHIDTIDHYEGSMVAFHFPTRSQLLAAVAGKFSNARFLPSGTFELAERSPLLVMDKE
jgi:SAM-dependent methyltransferase